MFIQERSSNKISKFIFRIIIVIIACYATYYRIVLHNSNGLYFWIMIFALTCAFIFDQVTAKGYSSMEYFETEKAERKLKIENRIIFIFFTFIFGGVIVLCLLNKS